MQSMIAQVRLARCLLIVLLATFASFAQAEGSQEIANKVYYLCKNKKEVRTIRVHINEQSGLCSTVYSRDGAEKAVGSGKNQESCVGFLNNIKTNLEKSNWTCRDISSTTITASVD
jgi:hypothetical protein